MPCVVCLEGGLLTSKLANCNEVSSQRPHRAQITRVSCLKNPGERNAVSMLVQMRMTLIAI